MSGKVVPLEVPAARLGEAPLWDAGDGRLVWVDCDQKKMFRLDPGSGEVETVELPGHPGSYAWRARGGTIMAYRNRLVIADADLAAGRDVETPLVNFASERFNDGACDRRGRFWVGTMDRRLKEPVGSLYRVDPDLSIRRMETGLICSNGIAFSPDDRILYHTDTGAGIIYAYDFDADSGAIAARRRFVDFAGLAGRPDGCTIDADGCLWVALIGAGCIVRVDPAGSRITEIGLPARSVTSVAFGGADLRTLYVTSANFRPEREGAGNPAAGRLFAVELDVGGLPEPAFQG